jgi:hypothetical protein
MRQVLLLGIAPCFLLLPLGRWWFSRNNVWVDDDDQPSRYSRSKLAVHAGNPTPANAAPMTGKREAGVPMRLRSFSPPRSRSLAATPTRRPTPLLRRPGPPPASIPSMGPPPAAIPPTMRRQPATTPVSARPADRRCPASATGDAIGDGRPADGAACCTAPQVGQSHEPDELSFDRRPNFMGANWPKHQVSWAPSDSCARIFPAEFTTWPPLPDLGGLQDRHGLASGNPEAKDGRGRRATPRGACSPTARPSEAETMDPAKVARSNQPSSSSVRSARPGGRSRSTSA